MMTPYDPDRHHRRSIRLRDYDYRASGAYFVTICTHKRELWLVDNAVRRIVAETWRWLPERFSMVALDEFVIMPNHVHCIIWIQDSGHDQCRSGSRPAPTVTNPSLGQIVGAFKMMSAKRINEMRDTPGQPFWQRNYYERIIRNQRELNAIRSYIRNNPANWKLDQENPDRR